MSRLSRRHSVQSMWNNAEVRLGRPGCPGHSPPNCPWDTSPTTKFLYVFFVYRFSSPWWQKASNPLLGANFGCVCSCMAGPTTVWGYELGCVDLCHSDLLKRDFLLLFLVSGKGGAHRPKQVAGVDWKLNEGGGGGIRGGGGRERRGSEGVCGEGGGRGGGEQTL